MAKEEREKKRGCVGTYEIDTTVEKTYNLSKQFKVSNYNLFHLTCYILTGDKVLAFDNC